MSTAPNQEGSGEKDQETVTHSSTEEGEIDDEDNNLEVDVNDENDPEVIQYKQTIRQLSPSLRCNCCGDVYSDPVRLPICGHVMNRDCVAVKRRHGNVLTCPMCTRRNYIDNPDQMTTDFDVAVRIPPKPSSWIARINRQAKKSANLEKVHNSLNSINKVRGSHSGDEYDTAGVGRQSKKKKHSIRNKHKKKQQHRSHGGGGGGGRHHRSSRSHGGHSSKTFSTNSSSRDSDQYSQSSYSNASSDVGGEDEEVPSSTNAPAEYRPDVPPPMYPPAYGGVQPAFLSRPPPPLPLYPPYGPPPPPYFMYAPPLPAPPTLTEPPPFIPPPLCPPLIPPLQAYPDPFYRPDLSTMSLGGIECGQGILHSQSGIKTTLLPLPKPDSSAPKPPLQGGFSLEWSSSSSSSTTTSSSTTSSNATTTTTTTITTVVNSDEKTSKPSPLGGFAIPSSASLSTPTPPLPPPSSQTQPPPPPPLGGFSDFTSPNLHHSLNETMELQTTPHDKSLESPSNHNNYACPTSTSLSSHPTTPHDLPPPTVSASHSQSNIICQQEIPMDLNENTYSVITSSIPMDIDEETLAEPQTPESQTPGPQTPGPQTPAAYSNSQTSALVHMTFDTEAAFQAWYKSLGPEHLQAFTCQELRDIFYDYYQHQTQTQENPSNAESWKDFFLKRFRQRVTSSPNKHQHYYIKSSPRESQVVEEKTAAAAAAVVVANGIPHHHTLCIGNLPPGVQAKQIYDVLSKCGRVVAIRVICVSEEGQQEHFAVVSMDSELSMEKSVSFLNGSTYFGPNRILIARKAVTNIFVE